MSWNFRQFIINALPGTQTEILNRSGLCRKTVIKWVRQMRANREIHITRWLKHPRSGPDIPVYALGDQKDAPNRLKKLTKKQICARYYAKAKADGRYDNMQAKWRKRHWEEKACREGDPLINALFGTPAERLKAA